MCIYIYIYILPTYITHVLYALCVHPGLQLRAVPARGAASVQHHLRQGDGDQYQIKVVVAGVVVTKVFVEVLLLICVGFLVTYVGPALL